jgi:hypothetical protein
VRAWFSQPCPRPPAINPPHFAPDPSPKHSGDPDTSTLGSPPTPPGYMRTRCAFGATCAVAATARVASTAAVQIPMLFMASPSLIAVAVPAREPTFVHSSLY